MILFVAEFHVGQEVADKAERASFTTAGKLIFVFRRVIHDQYAELPKVARASGPMRALPYFGQHGENQSGQNADDGDHHQQFYQRESTTKGAARRGHWGH